MPLSLPSYQVLRVKVQSDNDRKVMNQLMESGKYDFWDFPRDVMVHVSEIEEFDRTLNENKITYDMWINDVQALVDGQFRRRKDHDRYARLAEEPAVHEFDYSVYHRYSELDQWIKDTVGKYPDLTEEFVIGRSYENRVIRVLKIGNKTSEDKEGIWLQSGIHAREWIAPATNIWMANAFLEEFKDGSANDTTSILNKYDIYVLPSVNPDGYEYTWDEYRLWRKTRSPNLGSDCVGTDPNRNWAYGFGGPGTSSDPCSLIYTGPYIHSEIEVRNIVNFFTKTTKTRFVYFNDIHSYSQLHLNPWGYQYTHPKDFEDHVNIASGIGLDWGYGGAGIKYSHSLELRDKGNYGFLLPEDQIIPTAEETFVGMKAAFMYMMNNP
uniref:Carboxypeptidase A4-like n=1 Tax=Saccoglossus kowalevskii TaxID=10224 RepID=A0ABM0MQ49_SACKO|nr:PREDICTED: carboxypeptidase A4-like [Saccoglossus kowalevskii]